MKYDFDPEIAMGVGVEEAILLSNIQFWCEKNTADRSEKHFHYGKYWTYSSERAWSELFPFWTVKQISRMTDKLEKYGLIITNQFSGSNRVKWYCPTEKSHGLKRAIPLAQTGVSISPNGSMEQPKRANVYIEQIITTDNNPDNNPDNKIISKDIIKDFKEFIETNKDNTSAIVLSYFFDLGYKPAELETVDTFRKWMEDAAKQSGKTAEQIKLKVFEWHTYFSIKKVKNHKSSFLNWITKEFKGTKSK